MTDSFSEQIRNKLRDLRDKNGGKIEFQDCDQLIDALTVILHEKDKELFQELGAIAEQIRSLKSDAGNVTKDSVEGAKLELDAIVKSTEDATHTILDAAEGIQKAADASSDQQAAEQIKAYITEIFTSCNFQDLTGQRISNVLKALNQIEQRVGNLLAGGTASQAAPAAEPKGDDALMNGPQLDKDAPSQDDIDKLFDQA